MAQSLLVFPRKKWSQPIDYWLKLEEFVVWSAVFIEFEAIERSPLEIGAKAYYHYGTREDAEEDGVCGYCI
jgi:hypothetical protein